MTGESERHARLVQTLVETVRARHGGAGNLLVLADHHSFGRDRPEPVDGHVPDLFARDVPETFRVIGEAKTPSDLETDRSRRQLAAFLDHLALFPGPHLYLAVPWFAAARAEAIVRRVRRVDHERVGVEIIRHG